MPPAADFRAWPGGGSGGARSWTGSLQSTPLAADFGPRPDGAVEGRLPWPGVCFSIFHSPASQHEAQLCSVTGSNTHDRLRL